MIKRAALILFILVGIIGAASPPDSLPAAAAPRQAINACWIGTETVSIGGGDFSINWDIGQSGTENLSVVDWLNQQGVGANRNGQTAFLANIYEFRVGSSRGIDRLHDQYGNDIILPSNGDLVEVTTNTLGHWDTRTEESAPIIVICTPGTEYTPTPTSTPQWTQPEPPAACSQIPVPPGDSYTLDAGTQEYDAWSWNGTIRDVTTPPGNLLPRWYYEDPGARIGMQEHTFYNDDPDTYDRVIFCPTDMPTPTITPTPTPDGGVQCFLQSTQSVEIIFDNNPTGPQHDNFYVDALVLPDWGGSSDVGFISTYPGVPVSASAPIWYSYGAFEDWTIRIIEPDTHGLRIRYNYMDGSTTYYEFFNDLDPYYLEGRVMGEDDHDYVSFIARDGPTTFEICRPYPDSSPPRLDQCVGGDFQSDIIFSFDEIGDVHVWDENLNPSRHTGYTQGAWRRAAATHTAWLDYDFQGWTLTAYGDPGRKVRMIYDSSADPGTDYAYVHADGDPITLNGTTESILVYAPDGGAGLTFELCPPVSIETNTPTSTPTETPVPTVTPIPPVGCYVQPIRPDAPTRLLFVHPTAIYRWTGEIDYTLSVTQSGSLEPFGQTALLAQNGDEVVFDPIQPPPELLLCPPDVEPTSTPTIDPYDDPRCEVLHSEYDPAASLHRIRWGDYNYRSTAGGYRLVLDENHNYKIQVLNGAPTMTSWYSAGSWSTIARTPNDGFVDYPVGSEYELASDYSESFSLQVCKDEPLPTPTSTPSPSRTATHTPLPEPTETPCISCEVRQTEAAAAPTAAAGVETIIALQKTVSSGMLTSIAEQPTLTPSNTPTYTPVPGPRARFDSTMYQVREAAGVVSVLVELSKAWNETVTVSYATEPGSALAGDDYTPTSGQVVFAPGEMSKVIDIPIVNDLIGEPDELFGIILTEVVNGFLGEYPASSILIQNDDSGAVTEEPDIPPECYAQDIYAPWSMLVITDTREITTIGIYGVYLTPAELTGEASIWGYVATPFLETVVPPGKYLAIPLDIEAALSMLADKELPGRLGDIAGIEESVMLQLCPVLAPTATAAALTATAATSPTAAIGFDYTPVPTFENSGIVSACLVAATPAPDLTGPQPQLDFNIPTMRPLPTIVTSSYAITTAYTGYITSVETTVAAEWIEPAATMAAWSDTTFGPDAWVKGEQDGQLLAQRVADAFGWLSIFSMIGALAWLLPPIAINLLIQIARAILSVMAYIRGWIK